MKVHQVEALLVTPKTVNPIRGIESVDEKGMSISEISANPIRGIERVESDD